MPGGARLKDWIEACPNQTYSALAFQGGAAWRRRLTEELGDQGAVRVGLAPYNDDSDVDRLLAGLAAV